jgi:hypothetical protein
VRNLDLTPDGRQLIGLTTETSQQSLTANSLTQINVVLECELLYKPNSDRQRHVEGDVLFDYFAQLAQGGA